MLDGASAPFRAPFAAMLAPAECFGGDLIGFYGKVWWVESVADVVTLRVDEI